MITIGTLKLDLVADREPFVHDLYGRWDTFNRTSLEGIVDEILSRYDTCLLYTSDAADEL